MNLALIISLLLFAQEPIELKPGDSVQAEILEDSASLPEAASNSGGKDTPGHENWVGDRWLISVTDGGPYSIEMHSHEFDSYLSLRDLQGMEVAVNDDGALNRHARLLVELKVGEQYHLFACAPMGEVGEYSLSMMAGSPAPQSHAEIAAAQEADFRERLAFLENKFGPDSEPVGQALNSLGGFLFGQRRYNEITPLIQRALEISIAAKGLDDKGTLTLTTNLAQLLAAQGDFEAALEMQQRVLASYERLFGPQSLEVSKALNSVGGSLRMLRRQDEALVALKRSLAIRQKTLGPDHEQVGLTLNLMAQAFMDIGEYELCRECYEQAIAIGRKIYGEDHPNSGILASNFAGLLITIGDFDNALPNVENAIRVAEKNYGPGHPNVSGHLKQMTNLLGSMGDFERARTAAERAVAIDLGNREQNPRELALAFNNLAGVLMKQGNYEDAIQYLEESIALWIEAVGVKDFDVAVSKGNLGLALNEIGRLDESLIAMRESLNLKVEILGRNHPQVATGLNNLGLVLRKLGDHSAALESFIEAVEIAEETLGANHPETAINLFNWGVQLIHMDRLAEALPLLARATELLEEGLGSLHPNVFDAQTTLGNTYRALGELELSASFLAQSLSGSLQYVDRELPTMSEADRLTLLEISASPYSFFESLYAYPECDLEAAFTLYSQWKGKATRLQKASLSLARKNQDPKVVRLKEELRGVGKELAALLFLPQDEQAENHSEHIQKLRATRLQLEREINGALDLSAFLATPDFAAIQKALPADAVLVDFFAGAEVYGWVIKNSGPPILMYFGMPQKLRDAQEEFLNRHVSRGGKALGPKEDERPKIAELLWDRVQPHVEGTSTILVCPDGFLCELPLGILPQEDGGYLLESYQFIYLSDPSQVIPSEATVPKDRQGDIAAIGDVNYFRRAEQTGTQKGNAGFSTRSRAGDAWSTLTGTRQELRSIQDLHEYVLEWDTRFDQAVGKEATEERVRELLPGHRYIHIATHGYFEPDHLPSLLANAVPRNATAGITEQVRAVGSLPGLLSGLVFAGVNGETDVNRDDGYLSAEEIQHLDLSACDLAVLSACETALGSKRAGEGLMSLRRAFEVAGADTVLSSLWKVDDQATAQLMKEFYTNLWQKGMSRGEALHQAKLRMLRKNRAEMAGDAQPSTWGAFVLSGVLD